MNREIKFRAYDEKNGMVYNPAFQVPGIGQVQLDNLCKITPNLMQYTGLKDKNGKEIFEGDIVKGVLTGKIFDVYWNPHGAWYINPKHSKGAHSRFEGNTLEVIGNIYEIGH